MNTEDSKRSLQEKYAELARTSLVRTQYSCSGNSDDFEESDFISYRTASDEDLPAIINLLAECKLPHSDIVPGKEHFVVAEIDQKIIGCAGFEAYNQYGLFRSLAVKPINRDLKAGRILVDKIMYLGEELGVKEFYLLTTTADTFFSKLGWEVINKNNVPTEIVNTPEFASICPSTAICMKYQF